jgi:hypothetical protein
LKPLVYLVTEANICFPALAGIALAILFLAPLLFALTA